MSETRWYLPKLSARAFHDPADYRFVRRLEKNAPIIRAELEARLPEVLAAPHPMGEPLAEGAWDALFLYSVGERRAACDRFPETTRIVESIPGARRAGLVYFSVLRPGAHVKPHSGPTNSRIRCHLGLITPKRAWLRVGGEKRRWQAGKCLLFDDSFVHESKNSSRELRAVLIVDTWHPELSRAERAKLYREFRQDIAREKTHVDAHALTRGAGSLLREGPNRAFAGERVDPRDEDP